MCEPIPVHLTLLPTLKCTRGCWFCGSGAGPRGKYIPVDRLLSFAQVVKRAVEDGNVVLRQVQFTGGGEPLEYPFLEDVAAAFYTLPHDSFSIITSGPWNDTETEMLRNIVHDHQSTWVSVSTTPSEDESMQRLNRLLSGCDCQDIRMRLKLMPDSTYYEQDALRQRVEAMFRANGYHYNRSSYMRGSRVEHREFKRDNGAYLEYAFWGIFPSGKAKKRLKHIITRVQDPRECSLVCGVEDSGVTVSLRWDSTLTPCCMTRWGFYPLDYDGLMHCVRSSIALYCRIVAVCNSNRGRRGRVCDLCPIRTGKKM